jgi:hypothetical protein
MLLHLRPRIFSPFENVALVDFRSSELGLHLQGRVDLVTRRPYPNRDYSVACRREGRNRAVDGILIETSGWLDSFHWVARWAIEAERVIEHTVHYRLLDRDFDAASDDMTFWYEYGPEDGGWPDRRPDWWTEEVVPCRSEPVMHALSEERRKIRETDDEEVGGWIVRRRQNFAMPTLERNRVLTPAGNFRRPTLASAFRVAGV